MKACDASLLAAYRIALVHGIVEPEVIAELIEQMFIATESPPAELLAAADAPRTSITEIASALTRLTAGADTSRTARLFMGLARAALLERPDLAEDVAHALHRMACVWRIVAVGGQVVETQGATVIVDGRELHQRPVAPAGGVPIAEETNGARTYRVSVGPAESERPPDVRVVVPPAHLFVMGDNRLNAYDSRSIGCIPLSSVKARILFRYL